MFDVCVYNSVHGRLIVDRFEDQHRAVTFAEHIEAVLLHVGGKFHVTVEHSGRVDNSLIG